MFRKYIFIFTLFLLTNNLVGQNNKYKIITQDVTNFWEAVDSLKNGKDTVTTFQNLVIDRATEEFKVFIKKSKIKASDYASQLKQFPKFYKTLRENSYKLINSKDSIIDIINRFKNLYPNFVHADICISFGNFYTGGTVSTINGKNLVYIGLEYHGLDATTFIKEFEISRQDYVSRSNFFRTIIHELVHIQQHTHGRKVEKALSGNLLAKRILSEGIPDFIAKLIFDNGSNGNSYNYGLENEMILKDQLQKDLFTFGDKNWFGGNDSLFINRPRDLGYFMGSRIGRHFYNKKNLQTNLKELIEIKNIEKFITESKYFEKL
jgi:hypothetical protein